MNQPFCSPVQALRSVLDAAALLPSPSPETIPLEAACGRIAAGRPLRPDGPAPL